MIIKIDTEVGYIKVVDEKDNLLEDVESIYVLRHLVAAIEAVTEGIEEVSLADMDCAGGMQ